MQPRPDTCTGEAVRIGRGLRRWVGVHSAGIDGNRCRTILLQHGLSANYNETIAHAIHSLTLEALQLFHPEATEVNHVPTVNLNLKSPVKVLPHAPDRKPGESQFNTQAMQIIDDILSHVGDEKDGLGPNWSTVERIVHNFHMWDLWITILRKAWPGVTLDPPNKSVCACVRDVDNNGVKKAVGWVADHYSSGTPITLLNRPIPKLNDIHSWNVWKGRLVHYYDQKALRDAATYLYCAV